MRSRRQEGFSLTELLVVLAVAGVMLLMLVPSLSSFLPRIRFNATVRQIATDISFQRLRAVERNETTTMSYDASKRTYTLAPYGIKRVLPREVSSLTLPSFQFNSRGLVLSGNAVTIQVTGQGGRSQQIEVSPAGRVKFSAVP